MRSRCGRASAGRPGILRGRDMTPDPPMLAGIIAVSYAYKPSRALEAWSSSLGANLDEHLRLVTLAVPMSLLQTGTIVLKHRGIDWTVLLRRVFPWMGTGLRGARAASRARGGVAEAGLWGHGPGLGSARAVAPPDGG